MAVPSKTRTAWLGQRQVYSSASSQTGSSIAQMDASGLKRAIFKPSARCVVQRKERGCQRTLAAMLTSSYAASLWARPAGHHQALWGNLHRLALDRLLTGKVRTRSPMALPPFKFIKPSREYNENPHQKMVYTPGRISSSSGHTPLRAV